MDKQRTVHEIRHYKPAGKTHLGGIWWDYDWWYCESDLKPWCINIFGLRCRTWSKLSRHWRTADGLRNHRRGYDGGDVITGLNQWSDYRYQYTELERIWQVKPDLLIREVKLKFDDYQQTTQGTSGRDENKAWLNATLNLELTIAASPCSWGCMPATLTRKWRQLVLGLYCLILLCIFWCALY